jgi:hypothetical protein
MFRPGYPVRCSVLGPRCPVGSRRGPGTGRLSMQSTGCGDSIRSRNVAGDRGAPFRGQNVEPGMSATPSRTVRPASVPTWESAYITYSPSPKPSTVPSQAHPQTGVRHPSVPSVWDFIHTRSSESGITDTGSRVPGSQDPNPSYPASCILHPLRFEMREWCQVPGSGYQVSGIRAIFILHHASCILHPYLNRALIPHPSLVTRPSSSLHPNPAVVGRPAQGGPTKSPGVAGARPGRGQEAGT